MKKILNLLSVFVLLGLFSLTSCEDKAPAITSITLEKTMVHLTPGKSLTLEVAIQPSSYKGNLFVGYSAETTPAHMDAVLISASSEDQTCTLKAVKEGYLEFYLYAENIKSSSCVVIVEKDTTATDNDNKPSQPGDGTDTEQDGEVIDPQYHLQLNKSDLFLMVGESSFLNASGVDAVEWSVYPEGIVQLTPEGLQVKVHALQEGRTKIVARSGFLQDTCQVVVENLLPEGESIPLLAAPGPNQVTIAIRVPQPLCNGVGFIGCAAAELGSDWSPNNGADFTLVEGTTTWWAVTLSPAEGKTLADVRGKPVAYPMRGKESANWSGQWGRNSDDEINVRIIKETTTKPNSTPAELGDPDYTSEPQIVNMGDGGNVIYLDIVAWQLDPCAPHNPGGLASFTMTSLVPLPEGAAVKVVGNWMLNDDDSTSIYSSYGYWDLDKGYLLTKEGSRWVGEVPVPAEFQYKYVWSQDGDIWSYDCFQWGGNINMSPDLNAVDQVEGWYGYPLNPIE